MRVFLIDIYRYQRQTYLLYHIWDWRLFIIDDTYVCSATFSQFRKPADKVRPDHFS
jgi:hypothetical protein